MSPKGQRRRGSDQEHRDAAEGQEDCSRPRRSLKPRAPIAVSPVCITTENSLQVAGLPPRKLREALAMHPEIPRSRLGQTLLVSAEAFGQLLERLRVGGAEAPVTTGEDDAEPTADELLARLGRRRTA